MKSSLAIALSLSVGSLALIPLKTIAQCLPEASNCQIEQFVEETQYNPMIWERTPQQFQQRRLGGVSTACSQTTSNNCENLDAEVENLRETGTSIQLQELRLQNLENQFSQ